MKAGAPIVAFELKWSRDRRTNPDSDDVVTAVVWTEGVTVPDYYDLRAMLDSMKGGDQLQRVIGAIQAVLVFDAQMEADPPKFEPVTAPQAKIDWSRVENLLRVMREYFECAGAAPQVLEQKRGELLGLILELVVKPEFDDLLGFVQLLASRERTT